MAEIALSATIAIETEMTCRLTKLEYIWSSTSDIQRFLNDESVINIGDTYPENDAQYMENGVVREIIAYLSTVYEIDEDSNVPLLKELVAMLTASRIGTAFSSAISSDPVSWAYRYENAVWASLKQRFINQDISELTTRSVSMVNRLIMSMRHERTITQEVR